jgi:hypothetical protein
MSPFWKRVLFILLIILVAGGAGLFGGVAGAVVMDQVWQARIRLTPTAAPLPAQVEVEAPESPAPQISAEPTQAPSSSQIEIETTEIQTAITQAVETVGPAVVTVLGASSLAASPAAAA